jgi:glycosidase
MWWVGMKNISLQVLVYGERISEWNVTLNYPGVTINRVLKVSNPNYIFVYLDISGTAAPGNMTMEFKNGKKSFSEKYPLLARTRDPNVVKGFGRGDLIYMLMPDRFSNGDTTNDVVTGMKESKVDITNPGGRHGGDLQGVINHLDYIKELGATTIWLNPVLVNDMPQYSYHGYAATDLYTVDPRFGGNDKYLEMIKAAHSKGLKVTMDYIYNHVGDQFWLIQDLPSPDWVHQFPSFTRCNYRPASLADPYGSSYDRTLNTDGWFDIHMPDLNQKNELLADYLIQNTIWWVEYAGIDAYRIDTYPYPDNGFMSKCLKAVRDEYPGISIVGETWEQQVADVAYWQQQTPVRKEGPVNYLPSCTDFMLSFAFKEGLNESFGWTTGLRKIYYTLAQDFLYGDAYSNMIFLDNHDVDRIYSTLKEDDAKWKQAITLLLTTRGIPQIYYGTEILMKNFSNPDGLVREDFPGGWPGDAANKFTAAGRNNKENEAFNYVKTLANWRKNNPVVYDGKLMQFVPDDDMYVYFRYNESECVMVILNTSDAQKKLDTKRFEERTSGFSKAKNVVTGNMVADLSIIDVLPKSATVLELQK